MANEIIHQHDLTGRTLTVEIYNSAGQIWDTTGTPAFETLAVAQYANYALSMTEDVASSYLYFADFPATIPVGFYTLVIRERATAGTPLLSDMFVTRQFGYWDGTTFKLQGSDMVQHGGTAYVAGAIPAYAAGAAGGTPVLATVDGKLCSPSQVLVLNSQATDGSPAVGSRPVLYLDRLDLHNDDAVYAAMYVANDNVSGKGQYIYGGNVGQSIYGGAYGQDIYGGNYGQAITGDNYGQYIDGGGVADILLAGTGTILDGSSNNVIQVGAAAALAAYNTTGVAKEASVGAIQTILTGITSLAAWLRGLYRKDTINATALSEINAVHDGGEAGTFSATTDSLEGIRDTAPLGDAMRGTDGAYTGTPPTAAAIADAVADEAITGHTGFLAAIYRRWFGKVVKDSTTKTIKTYNEAGTAVAETQTFTETSTVETINKAT